MQVLSINKWHLCPLQLVLIVCFNVSSTKGFKWGSTASGGAARENEQWCKRMEFPSSLRQAWGEIQNVERCIGERSQTTTILTTTHRLSTEWTIFIFFFSHSVMLLKSFDKEFFFFQLKASSSLQELPETVVFIRGCSFPYNSRVLTPFHPFFIFFKCVQFQTIFFPLWYLHHLSSGALTLPLFKGECCLTQYSGQCNLIQNTWLVWVTTSDFYIFSIVFVRNESKVLNDYDAIVIFGITKNEKMRINTVNAVVAD